MTAVPVAVPLGLLPLAKIILPPGCPPQMTEGIGESKADTFLGDA